MAKIVVGMSGGVDSAVAAYLLKSQGHDVTGVFMRNWDAAANNDIQGNPTAQDKICPEEMDWADVQKVGQQIGIPVQRVDFVAEYWDYVFNDLVEQYRLGRTPNPDILCNKFIKFGVFMDWINKNVANVDYIATGHYAALKDGALIKPRDSWKDQTYFLAQVPKERFHKILFPLADLPKTAVRRIAMEQNLVVANKKDSTGICFVGERNFTNFLQNYIPAQPGAIVDITTGQEVGRHVGAMYFTIGKRSGIGLSGMSEPYHVVGHDLPKRFVYVAPQSQSEFLLSDRAIISDVNWLVTNRQNLKAIEVKFRYKSDSVLCNIEWIDNNHLVVHYPDGFTAVTPGQQAVFYQGQQCLGGGTIDRIFWRGLIKPYI